MVARCWSRITWVFASRAGLKPSTVVGMPHGWGDLEEHTSTSAEFPRRGRKVPGREVVCGLENTESRQWVSTNRVPCDPPASLRWREESDDDCCEWLGIMCGELDTEEEK